MKKNLFAFQRNAGYHISYVTNNRKRTVWICFYSEMKWLFIDWPYPLIHRCLQWFVNRTIRTRSIIQLANGHALAVLASIIESMKFHIDFTWAASKPFTFRLGPMINERWTRYETHSYWMSFRHRTEHFVDAYRFVRLSWLRLSVNHNSRIRRNSKQIETERIIFNFWCAGPSLHHDTILSAIAWLGCYPSFPRWTTKSFPHRTDFGLVSLFRKRNSHFNQLREWEPMKRGQ